MHHYHEAVGAMIWERDYHIRAPALSAIHLLVWFSTWFLFFKYEYRSAS